MRRFYSLRRKPYKVLAQADLISCVLEDASVDARTISYIEAHGTGTLLGDPMEINYKNRKNCI